MTEQDERRRLDPTERVELLLRDLRASRQGLSSREAERRLVHYGPNEITRRGGRRWPKELAFQFTHPLALLLWVAAGLAWLAGIVPVAIAIVIVIVVNALFAFVQEIQAERAVEALAAYLPVQAKVVRDGRVQTVEATTLVPGDLVVIEEGDRICADARLVEGGLEVNLSTLTGESMPAYRSADLLDTRVSAAAGPRPRLQRHDLHRGRGQGRCVRDRHAHRDRSHRRAVRTGRAGGEPVGVAGTPGRLADRHHRGRTRDRVHPGRDGRSPACRWRTRWCSPSDYSSATCPRACCR